MRLVPPYPGPTPIPPLCASMALIPSVQVPSGRHSLLQSRSIEDSFPVDRE